MLNFEEELEKFQPSMDVEKVEVRVEFVESGALVFTQREPSLVLPKKSTPEWVMLLYTVSGEVCPTSSGAYRVKSASAQEE